MSENLEDRSYYVYRHLRGDKVIDGKSGTPFYIGQGKKAKEYNTLYREYTRAFSKGYRNNHWRNITAKYDYVVEILVESLTKKEADIKEKEFIRLYGREDLGKGCLCNMSDDGEGTSGHIHTEATKQKLRDTRKERGITTSAETVAKIVAKTRGQKRTPEQIEALKRALTGTKKPPRTKEHQDKITTAITGKKRTGDFKENLRNHQRKNMKAVLCIETAVVYDSVTAAAEANCKLGREQRSIIRSICTGVGPNRSYKGLTFSYV